MKRIAWLTDIHLNFLTDAQTADFLAEVAEVRPDAVLISGDIAESHDVDRYLERLQQGIGATIDFVLGNHDFYHGSIAETRGRVAQLCAATTGLNYLTLQREPVRLSPHVGLVGHDGWADGRAGDFMRSGVSMFDYRLISDLAGRDRRERLEMLHALGDEAASHVREILPRALAQFRDVVFLTHVPPVREACWHGGHISDDEWSPHFTCVAVGEALLEVMTAYPNHRLTVLCGHTHGQGETQPLPNVQILTGGAEYGHPAIQRVMEFD
ncbi:MAG: metallophosphoesterase [Pirellulales bacterium]